MDALVMCGGRGTRLDAAVEKPLYRIGGSPMVDRVADALAESAVDRTYFVVSPHTPETNEHLSTRIADGDGDSVGDRRTDAGGGAMIETPGGGYVADLGHALDRVATPVLTVAADLPLLAGDAIDDVLAAFTGDSLAVHVAVARKRQLGVSVDTTRTVDGRELAPTGVNVVADGERDGTLVVEDDRLAVNVNRLRDAQIAEALL